MEDIRGKQGVNSVAEQEWLSRKQASSLLHSIGCPISVKTLENMAVNDNAGKGPPYTRFRWKAVRYRRADLIAWAQKEAVRIE